MYSGFLAKVTKAIRSSRSLSKITLNFFAIFFCSAEVNHSTGVFMFPNLLLIMFRKHCHCSQFRVNREMVHSRFHNTCGFRGRLPIGRKRGCLAVYKGFCCRIGIGMLPPITGQVSLFQKSIKLSTSEISGQTQILWPEFRYFPERRTFYWRLPHGWSAAVQAPFTRPSMSWGRREALKYSRLDLERP